MTLALEIFQLNYMCTHREFNNILYPSTYLNIQMLCYMPLKPEAIFRSHWTWSCLYNFHLPALTYES